MQGLQHEAVAAEGDHAIRPGRIGIAMQASKPLRRLAGFRRVRGQEGDRIEFHAVFIALTGPDIAYMEGQPLGNSLRAAPSDARHSHLQHLQILGNRQDGA